MENRNILIKALPYLGVIVLAAVARIIPHAPNFAPVGALAIFTGYHFKNKFSWWIPIAAMVLSDFVIGFHSTVPYVYTSFIIMSLIGSYLKKRNARTLFLASLASSVLFFLVTNFGVWVSSSMYAKNVNGLIQSYLMAIPFFRNTALSDLFYTFSFFYGYGYLASFVRGKTLLDKSA
jgi:hypothetical protein